MLSLIVGIVLVLQVGFLYSFVKHEGLNLRVMAISMYFVINLGLSHVLSGLGAVSNAIFTYGTLTLYVYAICLYEKKKEKGKG